MRKSSARTIVMITRVCICLVNFSAAETSPYNIFINEYVSSLSLLSLLSTLNQQCLQSFKLTCEGKQHLFTFLSLLVVYLLQALFSYFYGLVFVSFVSWMSFRLLYIIPFRFLYTSRIFVYDVESCKISHSDSCIVFKLLYIVPFRLMYVIPYRLIYIISFRLLHIMSFSVLYLVSCTHIPFYTIFSCSPFQLSYYFRFCTSFK